MAMSLLVCVECGAIVFASVKVGIGVGFTAEKDTTERCTHLIICSAVGCFSSTARTASALCPSHAKGRGSRPVVGYEREKATAKRKTARPLPKGEGEFGLGLL
jgi:hypothetical protein